MATYDSNVDELNLTGEDSTLDETTQSAIDDLLSDQTEVTVTTDTSDTSADVVSVPEDTSEIFVPENTLWSIVDLSTSSTGVSVEVSSANLANDLVIIGSSSADAVRFDDDPDLTSSSVVITFDAGKGNDTVEAGASRVFINAGEGNDSILGGSGADTIISGQGEDTVSFSASEGRNYNSLTFTNDELVDARSVEGVSGVEFTFDGETIVISDDNGNSTTSTGADYIQIGDNADNVIQIMDNETEAGVSRLYEAFGRKADGEGIAFWTSLVEDQGTDATTAEKALAIEAVAQGFLDSEEGILKLGSLSNEDYVEAMYSNVLGRSSDEAGLNYWTTSLDNGNIDQAKMLATFAASDEAELQTEDYILIIGTPLEG
jgi:hypothetical protein